MIITVRITDVNDATDRAIAKEKVEAINEERTRLAGSPTAPGYVAPVLLPLIPGGALINGLELFYQTQIVAAHNSYRASVAASQIDKQDIRKLVNGVDVDKLTQLKTWLLENQRID